MPAKFGAGASIYGLVFNIASAQIGTPGHATPHYISVLHTGVN